MADPNEQSGEMDTVRWALRMQFIQQIIEDVKPKALFAYAWRVRETLAVYDERFGGTTSLGGAWEGALNYLYPEAAEQARNEGLGLDELAEQYERDIQQALNDNTVRGGRPADARTLVRYTGQVAGGMMTLRSFLVEVHRNEPQESLFGQKARQVLTAMRDQFDHQDTTLGDVAESGDEAPGETPAAAPSAQAESANGESEWFKRTYHVRQGNWDKLQTRIRGLSRKAEKLGLPAFELEHKNTYTRPVKGNPHISQVFHEVDLWAAQPKVAGWQFLARIDHTTSPNTIDALTVDDKGLDPEQFQQLTQCKPHCEHCQKARDRNTTYYLKSAEDDNRVIQVGSSCLKDFTGHSDPHQIADMLQWAQPGSDHLKDALDDDDEDPGLNAGGGVVVDTTSLLAVAAGVVRRDGGWISRESSSTETGSSDEVMAIIGHGRIDELTAPSDWDKAAKVVEWVRDEGFDVGNSTYRNNLKAQISANQVNHKKIGLVASAVSAYDREFGASAKQRQPLSNTYIGKPNEKIERDVTVEKVIPYESRYGVKHIALMRDHQENARVVWHNSGSTYLAEGQSYRIRGTVKAHNDYRGKAQTLLTRVQPLDTKPLQSVRDRKLKSLAGFQKEVDSAVNINAPSSTRNPTSVVDELGYRIGEIGPSPVDEADVGQRQLFMDALSYALEQGGRAINTDNVTPIDVAIAQDDHELAERVLAHQPELAERADNTDNREDLARCSDTMKATIEAYRGHAPVNDAADAPEDDEDEELAEGRGPSIA